MPPIVDRPAHQAPLAWWNETLHGLQAGVDEAGRGPLAGPVVAAAVILEARDPIDGLDDSKKLTPARRAALYDQIRARALCCAVAEASVEEIDRLNILHATLLAMQRAVQGLRLRPGRVLVDGNRVPVLDMLAEPIIGGDALVPAISAASILAKVHRDRWCVDFHREYPAYGFDAHKGYGTAVHLEALRRHGPCPQHRRSFAPVREADRLALLRQGGAGSATDAPGPAAAPAGGGTVAVPSLWPVPFVPPSPVGEASSGFSKDCA